MRPRAPAPPRPTGENLVLLVFSLLLALRLLIAARTPLSPDEAYYWLWSRDLRPGYLDHPAMVAVWIRAGTELAGQGGLGIRLLGPVSAALGSLALVSAGADFARAAGVATVVATDPGRARRAGLWAALLLNATLALGAGSVILTPDTPLLVCWSLALAALGRVLVGGRGAWWLAVGLAAGLALDSKYTAALAGMGLAGWLLATRDGRARLLREPWPWLGGLVALAVFAPTLWWNANHHWASFLKQGGRTGVWHHGLRYLGELAGGQIGLATPLVAVSFALGVVASIRLRSPATRLLLWQVGLPGAVFVAHATGDRVQANWPTLIYPALAIAAGLAYVSGGRRTRTVAAAGVLLGFGITGLVYAQAAWAPFAPPPKLDITLARLAGWTDLAAAVQRAVPPGMPIAADEYGLAAELAHDLPPDRIVLGAEPRWALFGQPHAPDGTFVLVRRLRPHDAPDATSWQVGPMLAVIRRCRNAARCADSYGLYPARPAGTDAPLWVLARPPS